MAKLWYGVIGDPVGHSVSPAMMNAAFAELGLDATYLAFHVTPQRLSDALQGLKALGASGVNVTIPHKQAVIPFATSLSPEAQRAGAVNTLAFRADGAVFGHNTDVEGWWRSVEPVLPDGWRDVAVLGVGGAARGVLTALSLHAPHCRVTLVGRDAAKTEQLGRDFSSYLQVSVQAWDGREGVIGASDLAVNATSIGMWPNADACPVGRDTCFTPGQVVQDMVYAPMETNWLQAALRCGATVVDGLQMLVGQGAAAFTCWTGQAAPVQAMQLAAETALAKRLSAVGEGSDTH